MKNLGRKITNLQIVVIVQIFLFSAVGLFINVSQVNSAVGINRTINFQGKIVNKVGETNITNGSYSFTFKFFDAASGGTQLPSGAAWTETKSLTVTDGVFRTALGDSTAIPSTLDFNSDSIYLDMTFNSETFTTRIRMSAVAYAFNAEKVAGLTVTNTTGTLTIPNAKTISFADAFTTSGAFPLTLTQTASTNVTLPTTGTLVAQDSTDTLTNKTIGSTGLTFSGASTDIDTAAAEGLVFQGRAASSFSTTAGTITFQAAGSGTISTVQIGAGGAGSTTPDFLGLDVKSDTGDPAGGFEGAMYYNTFDNKFRCYQGAAWADCITAAGSVAWSAITDPSTALTLNHGTNLTTFNFANTTTTGFLNNFNSLTSGTGFSLASTATAVTGTLADITLSGSNAANTGTLLSLTNSGTANANTSLYIKHYATGTNNLAFRVDDESGDTTPFVIDGTGNVGIGTSGTPSSPLSVGGTTGNFIVDLTGNALSAGYMRVGSTTAPANTTAGDLTATRLSVGNAAAFSAAGRFIYASGTSTATAASADHAYALYNNITPTSNSAAEYRALLFRNVFNPATTITSTGGITGGRFENRVNGDGLVTLLTGVQSAPFIADSNSASTLQATTVVAFNAAGYSRPSGTSTSTIGTLVGYDTTSFVVNAGFTATDVYNARFLNVTPASATVTNQYGLSINSLTKGTNNAAIITGEATGTNSVNLALGITTVNATLNPVIPTGQYSIYNLSTKQNYFAGNLGILDTTPAAALTVGDGDLFQVNSSGAITAATGITTTGNFSQTGSGTFGTGTGAVSLNGDTTIAAGKNLVLASGTGTFTQTYTGTGNATSITSSSTTDLNKSLSVSQTGATTGTDYAGYFSNTGAGTNNVGLYATATGATNNYAAIFENGNVGIGTTAPSSSKLEVAGDFRFTGGATRNIYGPSGSGEELNIASALTNVLDLQDTTGGHIRLFVNNSTASSQALQIFDNITSSNDSLNIAHDGTTATINTSSAADHIALQSAGGNVGIGDTTPDSFLEVLGATEQLRLTHTDGTKDVRFTLDTSGNLTLDSSTDGTGSQTLALTGFTTLSSSGALSITSGGANALSLDAGGAAAVNVGNTNATSVSLCNSAACDTLSLGTNADADTISIGDSLDNVAITGDQWSITDAGVLTVASCTGCGAGGSVAWNAITVPTGNLSLEMDADTTTFDWDTLTSGNAFTMNADAITSGKLLNLSSTATAFTGTMLDVSLTGNNSANTGSLIKASVTGSLSAAIPLEISNAGTGNALKITQTGNTSASTSVGGAILLDNTGNTGAGMVIYSNQAAPAGHLLAVRADHTSFSQSGIYLSYAGTANALNIVNNSTDTNAGSLNVTSANPNESTLKLTGEETGKGTIKITHTGTGTDTNASAISINLAGTGTASQGIFMDSTTGTTGKLFNIRNAGVDVLTLEPASSSNMLKISKSVSGQQNFINLQGTGAFSGSEPSLVFSNSSGNVETARISSKPGATYTNSLFTIATADSSKVLQPRLSIDVAGNLGIGDTAPDAKLEVLGTTEQFRLTHTDDSKDVRFTIDTNGDLTLDASTDGSGSEILNLTGFTNLTSSGALTVSSGTATNLTLTAGTTGDVIVSGDADTNFQVSFTAAPAVDMATISNSGQGVAATDGVDGLAITYVQAAGGAAISGSGLDISVTQSGDASDTIRGININNITNGNSTEYGLVIGTGWDRGLDVNSHAQIGSTLTATGTTVIGSSGNTFTFNPASGPTYAGTARPTKKIVISAEYPGAVLFGDGSNNTGTMTSDYTNSQTTANGERMTFYDWVSTSGSLQDYTIAVRFTLPSDFDAWDSSPLVFEYMTENTTNTNNQIDYTVFLESSASSDAADSDNVSTVANEWTSTSGIASGDLGDCNAAGETCVIEISVQSLSSNNVKVGDITLNYKAKF